LLAQAYAEGAPLHPSFPAAHAEIAGACVTILKAFTEPSFRFPNTVCVSRDGLDRRKFDGDLTLEGELNKLAWNMAFGRSFAGVHYRSDLEFGLALGENIGLQLLSELNKDVVASPSTLWFRRFDGSQTSIVV
jgi:hypothetical protein